MRRTQIYLTDQQRDEITRLARDAGTSGAEVIRRILDESLGLDDHVTERIAAVDATAGVLTDAPDWPDWLSSVRGTNADERLRELGT